MATRVRVQCINKTPRQDPHLRIRSIGGVNPNGSRWKLSEDQAIQDIKAGKFAFYVERPAGRLVDVIIALHNGHEYLKTVADGQQPDNLLSLPECP